MTGVTTYISRCRIGVIEQRWYREKAVRTLTVGEQKELQSVLWERRYVVVWEKLWFPEVVVRNRVMLCEIDAEGRGQGVVWSWRRLLWFENICGIYSQYYAEMDGADSKVDPKRYHVKWLFQKYLGYIPGTTARLQAWTLGFL